MLHDVVDPYGFITIIIIVRLPDGAKRVDRHLIIVTEVVSQHLELAAIQVATKYHATEIRFPVVDHGVTTRINDSLTIAIMDSFPRVTEVPIKFPIGTKDKRVG